MLNVGDIYQLEGNWYAKILQISKKEFKNSKAEKLYVLPADDLELDHDEFFIRVRWFALVGDDVGGISVVSRLPDSSLPLRGIRELIPMPHEYIVRESMIDYPVCLYLYETLRDFPHLAIEESIWMFHLAEDSPSNRGHLANQSTETMLFGAGMLTLKNAIQNEMASCAGKSTVRGFQVIGHGLDERTMNHFRSLFPQQVTVLKRSKRMNISTSGNLGSTAGIKMRKHNVTYDTWKITFVGNKEVAYIYSVFGEDCTWNARSRTWRAVRSRTRDSIPENETIFVLKDTPTQQASISFECRVPSDGTSLLGIIVYVQMRGTHLVIPNDRSARKIRELIRT